MRYSLLCLGIVLSLQTARGQVSTPSLPPSPLGSISASAPTAQPASPQKDQQAIAVLQQSIAAMGGTVPSDFTATGTIETEAGGLKEQGTIVIRTKGTNQSSEDIQTPHGFKVVFSDGEATRISGASSHFTSVELGTTAQAPEFMLPVLVGALANSDTSYSYVGLETLEGISVNHIRFWNSFSTTPVPQELVTYSVRDVWIDAASNLPRRVSYIQKLAEGYPGLQVGVDFVAYQTSVGFLYPSSIKMSLNGTAWGTVAVQNVLVGTGLTDNDFSLQ